MGYNECTYFSRVFKKYEGISAQEYLSRTREMVLTLSTGT
ncbi:MAG: hypothetical protein IJ109_05745 [Firmicutes bacterium]|nr:hypothetical protein [Bacillota bacterium]